MIEIIIEPAPMLIDAMQSKTAPQLIDLIQQSAGCDRLASISIHLTAIDILMRNYPHEYQLFENSKTRSDGTDTRMDKAF